MSSSGGYILDNVNITEEHVNFHVIKPKFFTWILLLVIAVVSIVIASFVFSMFQYYYLVIPPIIITIFLTPILYNTLGMKISNLAIVKNFELWKEDDAIENRLRRVGNFLLGIKFYPKESYFLQGDTSDLDLNEVWTLLKGRIFEIIAASIGLIFGLLTLISPLFPEDLDQWSIFSGLLFFVLLTPLLTFWLVPIIWTAQDSRIRALDEERTIADMGEDLSNSILSDVLGLAGLALGFSFLLDFTRALHKGEFTSSISYYIMALVYLGIFVLLITGICLLAGIIYLTFFHEKNVAKTREKLVKIGLPVGVTLVRGVRQQELNFMKKILKEKTEEKK